MQRKLIFTVFMLVILLTGLSTGIALASGKDYSNLPESALDAVYRSPEAQHSLSDFVLTDDNYAPVVESSLKKSSDQTVPDMKMLPNSKILQKTNAPANISSHWDSYLSGKKITCMVEDNYGGIWFGTYGYGVSYLLGGNWYVFNTANSSDLPSNYILSAAFDKTNNVVYFGSDSGLFYIMLPSVTTGNYIFSSGSNANFMWSLAIDYDGELWIGTKDGIRHGYRTASAFSKANTTNSSLPVNEVYSVAIDNNNTGIDNYRYYIGTKGGGYVASKYSCGTNMIVHNTYNDSYLRSNYIYSLAVDRYARLWVGTGQGLYYYDHGNEGNSYYNDSTNKLNIINSIALDTNNYLWLATEGGLDHMSYDLSFDEVFTTSNSGLPNNSVYSVLVDSQNNKWAGTYGSGVARMQTVSLANLSLSGSLPSTFYSGDSYDLSNLILSGTDSSGNYYDLTGETVTWYSSNESVACISGNMLYASSPGQADIIAQVGSVQSNSLTFTVSTQTVSLESLSLSGSPPSNFYSGDSYDLSNLTLSGTDSSGNYYDLTGETVTWYSSNESVAYISGNMLYASSPGQAVISANVWSVQSNGLTFTVNTPTKPKVSSKSPVAGATNVAVNATVNAVFDMDLTAVTLSSITVKDNSNNSPGGVSTSLGSDKRTITIAHNNFANSKVYTVTIPSGSVKSSQYNSTNDSISWSFTTAAPTAKPQVVSTTPFCGETYVSLDEQVEAVFDMDLTAVNLSSVTIKDAANNSLSGVSASLGTDKRTVNIAHNNFAYNTVYTVTIPSGSVKSTVNNTTNDAVSCSFTTLPEPDQYNLTVATDKSQYILGIDAVTISGILTKNNAVAASEPVEIFVNSPDSTNLGPASPVWTDSNGFFSYTVSAAMLSATGLYNVVVYGATAEIGTSFEVVANNPVIVTLDPPSGNYSIGDTVNINAVLDGNVTNLSSVELHLTFDPTFLQLTSVSKGSSLNSDWSVIKSDNDNVSGKVNLAYGTISALVSGQQLSVAQLTFKTLAQGSATIRYDFDQANNRNTFYQIKVNNVTNNMQFTSSNNGYYAISNVAVTGVNLDKSTLALIENGATANLTATVAPSNATNMSITWTSSKPEVATVTAMYAGEAVVTPLSAGSTIITVTTSDGGYIATCNVNVAAVVTNGKITGKINLQDIETGNYPGIDVYLYNNDNATIKATITTEDGSFELLDIPSGTYYLIIAAGDDNCLSAKVAGITVSAGETTVCEPVALTVGDVNGDDIIGGLDCSELLSVWNKSNDQQGYNIKCDFNRDGKIGGLDFNSLLTNWNKKGSTKN